MGCGPSETVEVISRVSSASSGLASILPRMVTDIVLDTPQEGRRVVVDTKFSSILASRRFGGSGLKSNYLYQMYAYVRSQEGLDPRWDKATGLFLHSARKLLLRDGVRRNWTTSSTRETSDLDIGKRILPSALRLDEAM